MEGYALNIELESDSIDDIKYQMRLIAAKLGEGYVAGYGWHIEKTEIEDKPDE